MRHSIDYLGAVVLAASLSAIVLFTSLGGTTYAWGSTGMVATIRDGLTIGDTHEYEAPFAFDTVEEPYEHLTGVVETLLGRPLPRIRRRWAGYFERFGYE